MEPCYIPSKKLSTRYISCPTKMPTSPFTLLLKAAIICPKNPYIPFVDYCYVSSETTPFWNEEISAQGEIDKWESNVNAIFFIGYGKQWKKKI